MLTEQFVASVGVPVRASNTSVALRDAGIFFHDFQPLSAQRSVFKKSATLPHCLAVSATHVFAAQVDKAVVHVYNRQKGNQESTVPFSELITSISLACEDTVLVLGTVEGRIFLWEIGSGRVVTAAQAHLQAVTVLVVDANSTCLLSGSRDSTVNVWSLPDFLSFSRTVDILPLRTFSSHRNDIVALVLGHGAFSTNFAVSASIDKTCIIWDYHTGHVLRTYLLPVQPSSLALDPADRALYVGYEDGSVHQLDLYAKPSGELDAVQNGSGPAALIQPPAAARWKSPDASHGVAMALGLSFDGTALISAHTNGSIVTWDVPRGGSASILTPAPLAGPVTNLRFLPVQGFSSDHDKVGIQIPEIVKPKFGTFATGDDGRVPVAYAMNLQLSGDLCSLGVGGQRSMFETALTSPLFPNSLLDEGLCELAVFGKTAPLQGNGHEEDFMALDGDAGQATKTALETENENLKLQLDALRRVQMTTFEQMERLSDEKNALLARQAKRMTQRQPGKPNGRPHAQRGDSDSSMEDSDED